MPRRPVPRCTIPGCPNLAMGTRSSKCLDHWTEQRARIDVTRGTPRERGYDQAWEALRRAHLAAHPWCVDHLGRDELVAGVHVDHVEPIRAHPERRLDPTNLRTLCHPCHSARTARDQPGGWHATMRDEVR